MKILQIFGAVVAVHLLAFIFIFASPGCQSGPSTQPTPDATMPAASAPAPTSFNTGYAAQPADLATPAAPAAGHATPTRPGSANAVAFTPPKPVENVAPVSSYTVERGDSLWSIAKKHGLTVAELAKVNGVTTGTALKPGRKLIIPGKPGAAAPAKDAMAAAPAPATTPAAAPAHATNGEATKHTVAVGESLGVIARKYGISVAELALANNITDPQKVRAGQQLVIPGSKGARPVAAKSAPAPKPAATKPAAAATASAPETAKPAETPAAAPHFDLTPPPPGQDLDAGLKEGGTEVPTIKVEEPAPAPKN